MLTAEVYAEALYTPTDNILPFFGFWRGNSTERKTACTTDIDNYLVFVGGKSQRVLCLTLLWSSFRHRLIAGSLLRRIEMRGTKILCASRRRTLDPNN